MSSARAFVRFSLLLALAGCGPRERRSVDPPGVVADARAADASTAVGSRRSPRDVEEDNWKPIQKDFPFQSSALGTRSPIGGTVNKSIAIRLGEDLAVSFDTDLLRVAAGWSGDLLTPTGITYDTNHGTYPHAGGVPHFVTAPVPGWGDARGRFVDPRRIPYGPLPEARGRWDGLYVSGKDVVLSYTVDGTRIHEQPSAVRAGDRVAFVRTIRLDPNPAASRRSSSLLIADVPGVRSAPAATASAVSVSVAGERALPGKNDPFRPGGEAPTRNGSSRSAASPPAPSELVQETTEVKLVGAPAGTRLEVGAGGRILARLPPAADGALFRVVITRAPTGQPSALDRLVEAAGPLRLPEFRAGGARHWPRAIVTRGVRAADAAPYVVDRLTTPFPGVYKGPPKNGDWKDNAFQRRMMIAAFDFFPDGTRAALSTWEGDVWIVDGIDDDLDKLTWTRFASGLYEPMGLQIVDGVVHVSGRDQITRLHDLNGDGEADWYENFNNQVTNSPGFHEFQFDLQRDAKGNLYTVKASPVRAGGRGFGGGGGNGQITPFSGTVQRISPDGKRREVLATGLRAPNGIGVSPDGQVTAGDNEGTWMPACPIHWVRPGSFHGVVDTAHRKPVPAPEPPLCWISKAYDNSGGSQIWVTSDKWGPFTGELLHLSYGRATVYLALRQRAGRLMQGGIVPLVGGGGDAGQLTGKPTRLTSSAMRARFSPRDGQLYVTGLAGWQTDAVALTGFDRVRYTGKPVHAVRGLAATRAGVELTFTQPLDPQSVDPQSFSAERWNYVRSSAYGSPEVSVEQPGRRGHDRLEIVGARLSEDRRSVLLDIEDLRPAHQMLLRLRVKAADGTPIRQTVMHTIHELPGDARAPAQRRRVERGEPGLVLRLEPTDGAPAPPGVRVAEIAPSVKLQVRAGAPASPFLPPGPFVATWEGTLWPELRGPHVLMAESAGELQVMVNDELVLAASGAAETEQRSKPLVLDRKANRLRVSLRSLPGKDTTLRLYWARVEPGAPAPVFEPIPASALRHPASPVLAEVKRHESLRGGRELFLQHRCAACHLPPEQRQATAELAARAPSFAGIGSRLDWRWVREWVLEPRSERGDATMPALLHGPSARDEARAIAAYLATLRDPRFEQARDGIAKQVQPPEGAAASPAAEESVGARLLAKLRCAGCHVEQENGPQDGRAPLDHARYKFLPGALALYLQDPAAHFPWNPMPHFQLTRADAQALEAELRRRGEPTGGGRPPADAATIARGRELVQTHGCLRCHDGPGTELTDKMAATPEAKRLGPKNCPEGKGPARYKFDEAQVAQLGAFVASGLDPAARHVPREFAERQRRQLRCQGCHESDQFQDLPPLDLLGEKLRPEWMSAFLAGKVPYKPRAERHPDGQPWMEARMPAFAGPAVLLAEGLAAVSGHSARTADEGPVDAALAGAGATLVSAQGGFSCVACHGVGSRPPTQVFEVEGINLAHSAERLRPDFFQRWLRDPMRIDPSTKMPLYFDESGGSPLTAILGGRADQQIAAVWHYLRQLGRPAGRGAPSSRGL